jgi:hypothetical protein
VVNSFAHACTAGRSGAPCRASARKHRLDRRRDVGLSGGRPMAAGGKVGGDLGGKDMRPD